MSEDIATNVRIPEDLLRELKARAYRQGRSMAALLREALAQYLRPEPERATKGDPLAAFLGSFDSGAGDLATGHDRYLYGTVKQQTEEKENAATRRHQRPSRPRRSGRGGA